MCVKLLPAVVRKIGLWVSLGGWFLAGMSGRAGEVDPVRYLFVVETSSAMNAHKRDALSAIDDLVSSGLNGEMRPGEMFVVWTYDRAVVTDRYLAAPWQKRTRDMLAARTARALNELWFTGEARFDQALDAVFKLASGSEALTVSIINSGSPIAGTPFDSQINAAYDRGRRYANAMVFVTTLRVKDGEMVDWSVAGVHGPQAASASARPDVQSNQPAETRASGTVNQRGGAPATSSPVNPGATPANTRSQPTPRANDRPSRAAPARTDVSSRSAPAPSGAAQRVARGELPVAAPAVPQATMPAMANPGTAATGSGTGTLIEPEPKPAPAHAPPVKPGVSLNEGPVGLVGVEASDPDDVPGLHVVSDGSHFTPGERDPAQRVLSAPAHAERGGRGDAPPAARPEDGVTSQAQVRVAAATPPAQHTVGDPKTGTVPPKPAPGDPLAATTIERSSAPSSLQPVTRRPDAPLVSGPVVGEGGFKARTFLVAGLSLLACALAGLWQCLRRRGCAGRSSLISKSFEARH